MAQAFRHLDIGSTVQIAHYIDQRLTELRELVDRSAAETEMWEGLKKRPELPTSVGSFLSRRIDKLGERSRTDNGEAEMLLELRDFMNLCDECAGHGCTTYQDESGDVRFKTCGTCNGTGEKK